MNIEQIEQVVSEELHVPLNEINKKGDRKPLHVVGRFIVWSLVHYYGIDLTVEQLGAIFGYTHSQIVDGRKSLTEKMRKSIWLRNTMDNIKKRLDQNGHTESNSKVQSSRQASYRRGSTRTGKVLRKVSTRP